MINDFDETYIVRRAFMKHGNKTTLQHIINEFEHEARILFGVK